ncbi:MAG: DUF6794 domain-containing protein [Methylococcaceae bacterium]
MNWLNIFRTSNKPDRPSSALSIFPTTRDEAIARLLCELDDEQKRRLAAMSETGVEGLNYGLGAKIRKDFGLWHGNPELMRSCATDNPEDTSMEIIRATWAALNTKSQR